MLYVITLFFLFLVSFCSWLDELDPQGNQNYESLVDDLKFMTDETIFRRDSQSTLDSLIDSVYSSNLIQDALYEIATDDDQINTLVNKTSSLLKGDTDLKTLIALTGINITLNASDLWNTLLDSGIIQSTAAGLLKNEHNRIIVANLTGGFLAKNVWVGQILNNLGAGKDLTVQMLADAIKYTPNLNPKYNSSISELKKQQVLGKRETEEVPNTIEIEAREDQVSALEFLNNVINGALESQSFSTSLTSILASVNDTGIVTNLAMDLLQNNTILSMVPKLVSGLYDDGALDNLDLNKYFVYAKKKKILTNFLQWALTSPDWEPSVALLLLQMEQNGVYKDIEDGLYGPNK